MNATELIGKKAVRKGPIYHGNGNPDFSYCDEGTEILNATSDHIVLVSHYGNGEHILDKRWCDDQWIPYDTLVNENVKTRLGVLRAMQ